MDRIHDELSQALKAFSTIDDVRFVDAFCNFIAALERLFRLEEARLEELECPSLLMHLEQHARALSALHHLHSRIMAGAISEGREVVRHVLPQWLACYKASEVDSLKQTDVCFSESGSSFTAEEGSNALH